MESIKMGDRPRNAHVVRNYMFRTGTFRLIVSESMDCRVFKAFQHKTSIFLSYINNLSLSTTSCK